MNSKKEALLKAGKVPGFPNKSKKKVASGSLSIESGQIINKLHPKELKQLLGKASYPSYLDFSPSHFQLEEDDFLLSCPNVVKE
jgi:hypothetical protein